MRSMPRHILRLRALDALDADPGRADLGIAIHEALAEFVRRYPARTAGGCRGGAAGDRPRGVSAPLLSRPGAWAFWWPRFERIAALVRRRGAAAPRDARRKPQRGQGRAGHCRRRGGPFTITAIADRIDRLASRRAGADRLQDRRGAEEAGHRRGDRGAIAARRRDRRGRRLRRLAGGAGRRARTLEARRAATRPASASRRGDDPAALIDRVLAAGPRAYRPLRRPGDALPRRCRSRNGGRAIPTTRISNGSCENEVE